MEFLIVTVSIGALVVLAWQRPSLPLRVAVVAVALLIFVWSTPSPYRALRHVAELPDSAHVTENLWAHGPTTSFESGVFTMYRETQRDFAMDARYRLLAVASLAVLAVLPLRSHRARRPRPG